MNEFFNYELCSPESGQRSLNIAHGWNICTSKRPPLTKSRNSTLTKPRRQETTSICAAAELSAASVSTSGLSDRTGRDKRMINDSEHADPTLVEVSNLAENDRYVETVVSRRTPSKLLR